MDGWKDTQTHRQTGVGGRRQRGGEGEREREKEREGRRDREKKKRQTERPQNNRTQYVGLPINSCHI